MFTSAEINRMTDEEIAGALEEYRILNAAGRLRRPEWPLADKLAALQEAFRASAVGRPPAPDSHPLTSHYLGSGPVGVLSLAREIAAALGRPFQRGTTAEVVALGLTSEHFPDAVTSAATAVLRERPSPLVEGLRAICTEVRVKDYRGVALGAIDVDVGMPAPSRASGQPVRVVVPSLAAELVAVSSAPHRLIIPEQTIMADDSNFLLTAVSGVAAGAARAEARHLAELLSANELPGGGEIFSEVHGNLVSGTSLADGFAALRSQRTESGAASGLPCGWILCHPSDEVGLLTAIAALPEERRPRLVSNPFLPDSNSVYYGAPPSASVSLVRALMVNADESGISATYHGSADWVGADGKVHSILGIAVDLIHTVAIGVTSRVGLVRVDKS